MFSKHSPVIVRPSHSGGAEPRGRREKVLRSEAIVVGNLYLALIRQNLRLNMASEGGETGSRAHLGVQVAGRPRRMEHHPEALRGGLRGSVLLPTAVGLIAFAALK